MQNSQIALKADRITSGMIKWLLARFCKEPKTSMLKNVRQLKNTEIREDKKCQNQKNAKNRVRSQHS